MDVLGDYTSDIDEAEKNVDVNKIRVGKNACLSEGICVKTGCNQRNAFAFACEIPEYSADVAASVDKETLGTLQRYQQAKKEHGFNLTQNIRAKKEFGNPSILSKIIYHFEIEEIGSNYPLEVFDPKGYSEEDFEERIREQSSSATARTALAVVPPHHYLLSSVTTADTVVAQLKRSHTISNASAEPPDQKKRRSKWGAKLEDN